MPDERTGRNPLLLDIGCGINKPQGYIGLDREPYPGVDVVRDLMRGLPFVNDTSMGPGRTTCWSTSTART